MSTPSAGRLRTVVCGTNFGRFYIDAVRAHPGFDLAGILTTGSRYSQEMAARLGVPCYTSVDELPADVDAACVVVPSAVMGGGGSELGRALLERGVHVLQEHPVHPDELAASLRSARANKRQYRVNTHYPHVEPVRRFIEAAGELRRRQQVLFVDAASPVHVLAPMVDILARALGGVRPWRLGDPASVADEVRAAAGGVVPVHSLHGVIAGIPLTLRVQNQLHPGDRDNHALFWHRITIGTQGGVLTLADTHGPVLWNPRLHSPRDAGHRLIFEAGPGAEALRLPTSSVLGDPDEIQPSFEEVFSRLWPSAVAAALTSFAEAIAAESDPLRTAQHDLAVFGIWRDLMARLGPPELIRPPTPTPLAVEDLRVVGAGTQGPITTRPRGTTAENGTPEPDGAPGSGYSESAEFFDLGARDHTSRTGPAVVAALGVIDRHAGPLFDIGAGTGLVTRQIARALPGCQLIATEPAAGMRAVLTSRIADDPELASRVTVLPHAAHELVLPERISGAVACGVLGHLDAAARRALLRSIAARLAPGAPLVVELMGFHTPISMPRTRLRHAMLGGLRYEWWMAGEPSGADRMRLDTTWRVFDGEELIRESHDHYHWYPVDLPRIAEESGLILESVPSPHDKAVPHLGLLRGAEQPCVTT
ncbi:Gfo/Idh/MocA family oxidoreductase [Actinoalloteichus hymeniacidonis]|uniref:Thiazolinyl imide reductase n=1 Tax=Actinoalloteichus hymeniacidonis TaxID=340345 RepID=A0AAC9HQY4_9PSEU|nr:Gfo/Idh/MocA family oxidoreductase [Actinoalloteichus hymeniacidonis]AOS63698.1 thiazolinyl imide reductase [Actinoalloteichus hymeniacidonis]MBB5908249.1 thiazolinyl imide reductase [Actinoalloteichus hymeniacidonis]